MSPEHLLIGEETYTMTQSSHLMTPGTYYLVVDGVHLPPQGSATDLNDITASSQGQYGLLLTLISGWPTGTSTYYARGAQSQHTVSVNFQITN
jgi:hypothetical protein